MYLTTGLMCLALNVYHEARNQPTKGQEAVAIVTLNRADWRDKNICDEVFRPKQFSWANPLTTVSLQDRRKNSPKYIPTDLVAWEKAKAVAYSVFKRKPKKQRDTTHYHKRDVHPSWAPTMRIVAIIGDHIFYAPRRKA